jgi:lipoate---protein ligase
MFCIILETDDPFFNLALEEVLLKNKKEEYLILGINSPSIIIGKHQCAHKEVNTKFVHENNIPVIRRISGGGTVFHDRGNLNFTFIRESEPGKQVDFRKYTQPVIDFLISLGIDAKFEGKNDIKTDGLKISGNAEHVHRNRVLHHGTLLFSTALDTLRNSLRKERSCYSSRAVESNPSSVTNLIDRLPDYKDIYEFRSDLMKYLYGKFPFSVSYKLSQSEIDEAESLVASKYSTWEWNWAYGPEYEFSNSFHLNDENYLCKFFIKNGRILKCSFMGSDKLLSLEKSLIGCRHIIEDMEDVFRKENINISGEEIFNFF